MDDRAEKIADDAWLFRKTRPQIIAAISAYGEESATPAMLEMSVVDSLEVFKWRGTC